MIEQHKTITLTQPKEKPLYVVLDKIVSFQATTYRDKEDGPVKHCVTVRLIDGVMEDIDCNSESHANNLIVRLLKALEGVTEAKK